MRTGPLANALFRANPAMRGSTTPASSTTSATPALASGPAATARSLAHLPPSQPSLISRDRHPVCLRDSLPPARPRLTYVVPPKATPTPPPAIDNPFSDWVDYRAPVRNPAADDDDNEEDLLDDLDEFALGPPPPPAFPCRLSPRYSGCSTDSEGGGIDDEHYLMTHDTGLGSRRAKAIEQAQRQFRCYELDCLLDHDNVSPPMLQREQAQLFLSQELVPLACQKCGRIELVAITY
ncbi:hypothetical protein SPRG_08143 [Saprolegnia parasitica CBS 223.65]|uniref:Uncharacterized protein n=1 Tax=Saprolegnia parasitica (strain CBS 223.65) TaxID=695850 RepID=A0A067C8M5_SAPPC|nr:hypothetical protein SPRG_08143 [Saprolegnia parasitica CBS 223.65]KDO26853.1 hypothetical protein SPRG_08143 [Saprolegnia parasitica CBS 223.65]|eukprot:XP_012202498.1 hypothetical protein SPRG_08143 [Saprolegnia parasitica CBS 223.65]